MSIPCTIFTPLVLLCTVLAAGEPSPGRKAPFHVLFSDDTTHITSCVSPYHKKSEAWRPPMLQAAVDEVAHRGVDVHMIQLAHGQVPWYQSRVYSMADHLAWWKTHFGADPMAGGRRPLEQYLLDGGDLLRLFVERCRQTGQHPFVSLRLNDAHHVELVNKPGNTDGFQAISRFYAEHQQWRIGTDPKDWNQRTLDWTHPEVPDYMFSLVREQCENYDLDGFELDFMRIPSFFRVTETTFAQRSAIITGFVRRVREVLDRTARPGQRRWLCVRVPCYQSMYDRLGVDLPAMVRAGVDMVNLSAHYFTVQQCDMAAIRRTIPTASVYLEMCHTTRVGPAASTKSAYDNFTFRRTTPEQYYTAAHLAYARGLDGVSTFNFQYYREHGVGERGPFHEPPFAVLAHLGDRAWLARQAQHYLLAATTWITPRPLPATFKAGQSTTLTLDMAPPTGGWKQNGRLRIQGKADLGDSRWRAVLNGVELVETADRSEPYTTAYPPLLGTAAEHRAWHVPPQVLRDGLNNLCLTLLTGNTRSIVFVDLAAR
jgi:hypothetical protein